MTRKFSKARGGSWVNARTILPPSNLSITATPNATDPLTVTFTGRATSGGSPLTTAYWRFGDGISGAQTVSIASGTSTVTHTYTVSTATTYPVRMLVTAEDGQTAEATLSITVTPVTQGGEPGQGGGGSTPYSGTIFGVSERAPAEPPDRPTYIMNLYGGLAQWEVFDKHQSRCRTASGFTDSPLFKSFHTYDTSGFPSSLSGLSNRAEIAARGLSQLANIQVASSAINAGTHDAALTSLVRSIPAGIPRIWISPMHEPDLDATETASGWCQAVARFAKIIQANKNYNGIQRDVWTAAITTSFMWRRGTSNNGQAASLWLPYNAIVSAGADPGQVVWAPDGYSEDPTTQTPAERFDPALNPAKQAGFTQFGISEWGVKSYQPPVSGSVDSGSTISAAATYITRMGEYAALWKMQYLHYFHSGVGTNAGPEGWWMYTTACEREFGELCHYYGPVPTTEPEPPPPPTPTVPDAPRGVTATAGDAQVRVSWSPASSDPAYPVTGYQVFTGGSTLRATVGATTYTANITGLTNGTSYSFTVKATNSVGSSAASTAVSATPVAAAPPPPPPDPVDPAPSGTQSMLPYKASSFFKSRVDGAGVPINATRTQQFLNYIGPAQPKFDYPQINMNPDWTMSWHVSKSTDPIWKLTGGPTSDAKLKILATQGFHMADSLAAYFPTGTQDRPGIIVDKIFGYSVMFADAVPNKAARTIGVSSAGIMWHTSNGLDYRNPKCDDQRNQTSRGRIIDCMLIRRDVLDQAVKDGTGLGHCLHWFFVETEMDDGHCHPMTNHEGSDTRPKHGWGAEGERLRIKPSVNLVSRGLTGAALAVARTMQQNGAYLGDNSGSGTQFKGGHPEWYTGTNLTENVFAGKLHWSDFEVIEQGWQ